MGTRLPIALAAVLVLVVAGSPGAGSQAPSAGASARAFAIKVVIPGQTGAATKEVFAPPDTVQFGGAFSYPEDGSIIKSGPVTASTSASAIDQSALANASSDLTEVSLFGGEITAQQVTVKARASARSGQAEGDLTGTAIVGLVVLGQPVEASPGLQVALGDWGYALVLVQGTSPGAEGHRGFVTALEVNVTVDHGGLPAGSTIFVGYAEAAATAARAQPTPRDPRVEPPVTETRPVPREGRPGRAMRPALPPLIRPVPPVAPRLTRGGYVFPVHGPASFTDTFGAARAVVAWHHGEDIFAPVGAPVLAVASGTVFSVGWNDLGGNRLWLRDRQGNEFYYAHLSAFSPFAVEGGQVQAGDVLGFVGNSGDAEATPPHLHFEIHPVSLLGLGYDGVIPPYSYLIAWRRLEDVRFPVGRWTASVAPVSDAPRPGAFLLSSTDISTANGLEPGSLTRALVEQVSSEAPEAFPRTASAGRTIAR